MTLIKNRARPFLDIEDVVRILEQHADYNRYNTPKNNGSRKRHLVEMRSLYFYVMHNFTGLSLSAIGQLFLDTKKRPKDHATVLWAVKNFLPVYSIYSGRIRQLYEIVLEKLNNELRLDGYDIVKGENKMTRKEALIYIQHQRKIIFQLMKTKSE